MFDTIDGKETTKLLSLSLSRLLDLTLCLVVSLDCDISGRCDCIATSTSPCIGCACEGGWLDDWFAPVVSFPRYFGPSVSGAGFMLVVGKRPLLGLPLECLARFGRPARRGVEWCRY